MKKTKILLICLFIILHSLLFTDIIHAFSTNSALVERSHFTQAELQKIHLEVQNQIEESPQEVIPVLIKPQDYTNELKKGIFSIQSRAIQLKKAADELRIKSKLNAAGGKLKLKTRDYLAVELPANKLKELVSDSAVTNIYPDRTYYETLDKSAQSIYAPSFWNEGYRGEGIRVAVIDTGIDSSHPMLFGKVTAEKSFAGSKVSH